MLALAVSARHLVSGSYDTTVRFWDLETFRCVRKCDGHQDAVRVLAARSDEDEVYSGSYDGCVALVMWRCGAITVVVVSQDHRGVARLVSEFFSSSFFAL